MEHTGFAGKGEHFPRILAVSPLKEPLRKREHLEWDFLVRDVSAGKHDNEFLCHFIFRPTWRGQNLLQKAR